MTERLDRAHPLWHLDVVEHLDDGTMALIWRIHHSLADGATCMRICAETLWSDEPHQAARGSAAWRPRPTPSALALFALGLRDGGPRAPARTAHRASSPVSIRSTRRIVRRELRRSASVTALAQRVGNKRAVGFASAPLDGCRRAGKTIGTAVTLNDVILAIVAGGVRAWLEHSQGPKDGIRVKVPVSLHDKDESDRVANRDSYFFVDLPVAEDDPVERVLAINRETRERKLHHDAETLYRLGRHPFVSHWAMSARVFTFNISNVRGPSNSVYVLGARVRELYSLAEVAQHHALRIAVISCGASLFFGLCADPEAIADRDALLDGIRHSTDKLVSLGRSAGE
jgi:WS/DGAT/MGAT family acyltransferase